MAKNEIKAGSKVRITRGFRKGQKATVFSVTQLDGGKVTYLLDGVGTSGFYKVSSLKLIR